MGKISKSDQPARLPDDEQAALNEITARLSDPRRGHHAEGSKWHIRNALGRYPVKLHWLDDGTYSFVGEALYDKKYASLR